MTSWPSAGSWLIFWTSRRRRAAVKPAARSAGRFCSRLPMPKSPGVVDGGLGPQRLPFLVVLLDLRVLVIDVQRRDHPVGEDPGAELPGRRAGSLADDPPAEDQPGLVRPPDVQVVPDDLLEEDPPGDRLVQHLGEGELRLQHRDLEPVAGRGILGGVRARQQPGPLGGQVPDDLLIEAVADRLDRGGVIDGGEPVVQRREPDPGPRRHALRVLVPVAAQLRVIREIAAVLDEERPRAGVAAVEVPVRDHPVLPDDPRIALPLRVPPPGRGPDAHLLLRPADEHHALGPALSQEPGQLLAHHVVLALPRLEVHHRDAVAGGELPDLRVERLRPLREHGGRGDRLAQVLPDEPDHAQVTLQLRHVQVAVDAVDALQLEGDVTGQDISGGTG